MRIVKLKKKFNTGDYNIEAGRLKQILWYYMNVLFIRSGLIPFSSIIVGILRIFGAKIGKDVRIKPRVNIKYPWKLKIDDYSWIAECHIENLDWVHIGKNVCISQQAVLMTGNHDYKKSSFDLITKPICLEDGVWIGASTCVCPGVTAKSHAILTMGSVTNKDLEPYTIYQGNPAVKVRTREITE